MYVPSELAYQMGQGKLVEANSTNRTWIAQQARVDGGAEHLVPHGKRGFNESAHCKCVTQPELVDPDGSVEVVPVMFEESNAFHVWCASSYVLLQAAGLCVGGHSSLQQPGAYFLLKRHSDQYAIYTTAGAGPAQSQPHPHPSPPPPSIPPPPPPRLTEGTRRSTARGATKCELACRASPQWAVDFTATLPTGYKLAVRLRLSCKVQVQAKVKVKQVKVQMTLV